MRTGWPRKAPSGPVLSSDQFSRQGRAVRVAAAVLPDTASVRDFLNGRHQALNGRPLDLAIASDSGLAAVEAALLAARPRQAAIYVAKGE